MLYVRTGEKEKEEKKNENWLIFLYQKSSKYRHCHGKSEGIYTGTQLILVCTFTTHTNKQIPSLPPLSFSLVPIHLAAIISIWTVSYNIMHNTFILFR